MALILQFMTKVDAERLVTAFYVVVTSGVFAFLVVMLLLS